MGVVERVWSGDGIAPALARALLWPASAAYRVAMATRGRLYDAGVLSSGAPALPAISIGNLTVGGTGKTPFASWVASRLSATGHPAIVLRGYGGDEIAVHQRLTPAVPVIAGADRATAILEAQRRGADIVVLDDAFQHRRVRRVADVVLLGVEQLVRPRHVLPAGPWREPLTSARRADALVLTRKTAGPDDVRRVRMLLSDTAPGVPTAVVHLRPSQLRDMSGATKALETLRGRQVFAIAAIGEPQLFRQQLEALGARVTLAAFRDHHRFTETDILRLSRQVPADATVVCTLKDAVKLAGRWPGPSGLWYVSQQLVVEEGADVLDGLLERALKARVPATITAG